MNRALPTTYNSHLTGRRDTSLTDTKGPSRLSLRGFWVGSFLSFFLAIGAPYTNMAMRSTNMAFDFNTPGAIFLLFLLIGFFNTLLKFTARDRRLAAGLAAFVVGWVLWYYIGGREVDIYALGFWFCAFAVVCSLWKSATVWRGGPFARKCSAQVQVYVMMLVVSAL
ncbi:MAG: hypothetical protein VX293_00940, partial [Candidatus Latescibacterota bacterium]|nr:hypothetical protein [Candidatus Latescibacterota bacterium]